MKKRVTKKHCGEIRYNRYGQTMKIVEWRSKDDITVYCEDTGHTIETTYHAFNRGIVYSAPDALIGEQEYSNRGCIVVIVLGIVGFISLIISVKSIL